MTVVEELGSWGSDELTRLLTLRPDLLSCGDLGGLARTMTSRASTQLALEDLSGGPRQVLEAITVLPDGSTLDDLTALAVDAPDPGQLAAALGDLRERFLLHPELATLRLVGPVRGLVPHPLGLGRRGYECHEYTPFYELQNLVQRFGLPRPHSREVARKQIQALLCDAPALAAAFAVLPPGLLPRLRQLDREGPVVRAPGGDPFRGVLPQEEDLADLVLAGLVCLVGVGRVEVPSEVGMALRHPDLVCWRLTAPAGQSSTVSPDHVAAACGAAVQRLFEAVDGIVACVDSRPIPLLASGGVGVKELRGLAGELADPSWCATILTLLERLGLIDRTRKDVRTTKAWPAWLARPDAVRWSELTRAWLDLYDPPAVRPSSDRRLKAVLGLASFQTRAARERCRLLALLGTAAPETSYGEKGWLELWNARHPRGRLEATDSAGYVPDDELRADVLHEAELLALVADGASTPLARAAQQGHDLAAVLDSLSGAGETRVRAQADMTLVCTGVPSREMRLALGRLAAVEQSGAATVWRVSEQSLAGAFDDGDTAQDVEALLVGYAGKIPQAMSYLVKDGARRHGRVRVGVATSYVVVDDDALLRDALMAKGSAGRELAALSVRRIAPGVAVSRGTVAVTVDALRAAGVPAVAESTPGVKPAAAKPRRAAPARLRPLPPMPTDDGAAKARAAALLLVG